MELNVLSAGCIPGDILWSWGIVLSSSNLLLLSLFLFILCCPSSYSCLLLWFLWVFFIVCFCLCYPALLYVIRVPHTFPPCEIMSGSMGSFGCKLFLVVYLLFSHASLNPTMCFTRSLLFVFCILFPFQFVPCTMFYSQCKSLSAVYQACTKLSLKCYLHWFSARSHSYN